MAFFFFFRLKDFWLWTIFSYFVLLYGGDRNLQGHPEKRNNSCIVCWLNVSIDQQSCTNYCTAPPFEKEIYFNIFFIFLLGPYNYYIVIATLHYNLIAVTMHLCAIT